MEKDNLAENDPIVDSSPPESDEPIDASAGPGTGMVFDAPGDQPASKDFESNYSLVEENTINFLETQLASFPPKEAKDRADQLIIYDKVETVRALVEKAEKSKKSADSEKEIIDKAEIEIEANRMKEEDAKKGGLTDFESKYKEVKDTATLARDNATKHRETFLEEYNQYLSEANDILETTDQTIDEVKKALKKMVDDADALVAEDKKLEKVFEHGVAAFDDAAHSKYKLEGNKSESIPIGLPNGQGIHVNDPALDAGFLFSSAFSDTSPSVDAAAVIPTLLDAIKDLKKGGKSTKFSKFGEQLQKKYNNYAKTDYFFASQNILIAFGAAFIGAFYENYRVAKHPLQKDLQNFKHDVVSAHCTPGVFSSERIMFSFVDGLETDHDVEGTTEAHLFARKLSQAMIESTSKLSDFEEAIENLSMTFAGKKFDGDKKEVKERSRKLLLKFDPLFTSSSEADIAEVFRITIVQLRSSDFKAIDILLKLCENLHVKYCDVFDPEKATDAIIALFKLFSGPVVPRGKVPRQLKKTVKNVAKHLAGALLSYAVVRTAVFTKKDSSTINICDQAAGVGLIATTSILMAEDIDIDFKKIKNTFKREK